MKTPQSIMLALLLIAQMAASAQNSDCVSPSGAMQQPGDPTPTCFTGYSTTNTGALTQFYTFTATTENMEVELTPILGTACSFPNTAINYSNFQLYSTLDCGVLLGSSPNFTGLTIGNSYTFGLTMTPQDPACVWIAQSCPRVVEVVIPLDANLLYFTGKVDGAEVKLSWDVPTTIQPHQFEVKRRNSPVASFQLVGTVEPAVRDAHGYSWIDPQAIPGDIQYILEVVDRNGAHTQSDIMHLRVDARHMLSVFPNPCHDQLHINFPDGDAQGYHIVLCDSRGVVIHHLEGTADALNAELSDAVDDLPPGMYIVQSHDGQSRKTARFVKM